ncbi:hypothetical protein Pyn_24306 [Prunus yedoensis var. nudiflora]|uniref:LOB domain-containing protein n=1 Tax=Prunus yedoensis var. nudiflora TaxID=2094558 RepID=A0A314Y491_PRUYE|nr:hypothetical protein Pyn_24306 [Prunus yedoensis var. nudiflora]
MMTVEAQVKVTDPIYGCISYILYLQQQVLNIQAQMDEAHVQLACAIAPIANPNDQVSMTNLNQALENSNEQAAVANTTEFESLAQFSLTPTEWEL